MKPLEAEEEFSCTIKKERELKLFGHVARMDNNRWVKKLIKTIPETKTIKIPRKCIRKRFFDNISKMLMDRLTWAKENAN